MDIKNVFKQEAKSPPPQWAFITQEVREKFSPKKVRTRLRYKNQVEKIFFPVLKLNTNHKIGTKAIKIKIHYSIPIQFLLIIFKIYEINNVSLCSKIQ